MVVALRQSRAPLTRVKREVPEHKLEGLLDRGLEPMLTGVVHPCSAAKFNNLLWDLLWESNG